jgi:hypothetical protein
VALLVLVGAFQAALALGAPFGAAAWGGVHAGVLPVERRWWSAAAVPVYGCIARFVASSRPTRVRRPALAVLAVLFAIGALLNAASPSWVERAVWVPVASTLSWSLWCLRREESRGQA